MSATLQTFISYPISSPSRLVTLGILVLDFSTSSSGRYYYVL
jgi:hypothetical protein